MKQRIKWASPLALALALVVGSGQFPGWPLCAGEPASGPPPASRTAGTLTLDAALRLAFENNPGLRAAGGQVAAAAGRAYQARLWTNPELELSAEDWPVSGGGGFSEAKQTVGMAQTLPFPGKKKLDRQVGDAGVRVSEAELVLRRLQLARDVKTSFFQVLATERSVTVQQELVKVAEDSASAASKRVEAGAAADQEKLRADIFVEQVRTELAGLQRDQVTARQTLALRLGRPELAGAPIAGVLSEGVSPGLLDQTVERWLASHPSLVTARANRERARLEFRRARLEPYPDVRVGVAGGRLGETDQSIIQLGFSVPLPVLDSGKGKQREAQANLSVAEAEVAEVEQRLLADWGATSQRLRTAAQQVTNYRERILPAANQALKLVQTGFEQGKFGFIDLLDTQRTAAEARLVYQQKLLELNVAQADLEALLGRMPAGLNSTPAPVPQNKP